MKIDEIEVGMEAEEFLLITEDKILKFADISGDYNPIHIDEEYASKSRFKKRIAHGLISGSIFSGIFGTKIPGEGCVYSKQSFNFLKPVYIGDQVRAHVIVKDVRFNEKKVLFETKCFVKNRIVINGEAELFLP